MAKLKIIGRAKLEYVSQKVADNILRMKESYEPNHLVEIASGEHIELGQIKQIIPDDPALLAEAALSAERLLKRQQDMAEWYLYVDKCRRESIEQKARRMVNTWCALLWTARGNKPVMLLPEELKDKLMLELIKYFEENPNDWHAEQKVYNNLIPFGKVVVVSNVKGVVSMGETMQQKLAV